jgi:hypothetical protein
MEKCERCMLEFSKKKKIVEGMSKRRGLKTKLKDEVFLRKMLIIVDFSFGFHLEIA